MLNNRVNIRSPRHHKVVSPPHIQFKNKSPHQIKETHHLRVTLPNQSNFNSKASEHLSPLKNFYGLRNTTNNGSKIINNMSLDDCHSNKNSNFQSINMSYNYPNSQSHLISMNYEHSNSNTPNTARYSYQLQQLRQQLRNLKNNLKKIEQDVVQKQSLKEEHGIYLKKKSNDNQMSLSYNNNTDRTNLQSMNRNINFHNNKKKDLEEQQLQPNQKELINSLKLSQNLKYMDYGQKIDYIFNKLRVYQYPIEKSNLVRKSNYSLKRQKAQKLLSEGDEITSQASNAFLERINQKTLELRRLQIKHIALFMDIKLKDDHESFTNFRLDNIPEQWQIFEKQLNILIAKFQSVIQDHETTKSEEKKFLKNKKSINTNQYHKLYQENKLKEQQNDILKLQYTKLKNKLLEIDQQIMQNSSQLSQIKQLNKQYQIQIQRLQQLVESQNQKIIIINNMRDKKQDIQKEFQKVLQDLHLKNHSKEVKIIQLENIIKDNNQIQIHTMNKVNLQRQELNQFINKLQIQNQQLLQIIKDNKIQIPNKIDIKYNQGLKKLLEQLIKVLKLDVDKQMNEQQIIEEIIKKIKIKKYLQVYESYLEIIKLFEVQLDNPNHHEDLIKEIDLFRNDIKLLFNKVEELTQLNLNYQSQKYTLLTKVTQAQIQLKQSQQKINQMEKIINKQNDKALVKQMTWLNQKLSLKEQIKILQLQSKSNLNQNNSNQSNLNSNFLNQNTLNQSNHKGQIFFTNQL